MKVLPTIATIIVVAACLLVMAYGARGVARRSILVGWKVKKNVRYDNYLEGTTAVIFGLLVVIIALFVALNVAAHPFTR